MRDLSHVGGILAIFYGDEQILMGEGQFSKILCYKK